MSTEKVIAYYTLKYYAQNLMVIYVLYGVKKVGMAVTIMDSVAFNNLVS